MSTFEVLNRNLGLSLQDLLDVGELLHYSLFISFFIISHHLLPQIMKLLFIRFNFSSVFGLYHFLRSTMHLAGL